LQGTPGKPSKNHPKIASEPSSKVKGGGFEMFNASGSEVGVEVEEAIVTW
jgi:hypothetical protein